MVKIKFFNKKGSVEITLTGKRFVITKDNMQTWDKLEIYDCITKKKR